MNSVLSSYSRDFVSIVIDEDSKLNIFSDSGIEKNSLLNITNQMSLDYGEEAIQLLEGFTYEYEFNNLKYQLEEIPNIVKPSNGSKNKFRGRLKPGNYVGRLELVIIKPNSEKCKLGLEVRSIKANYRTEYRSMLEDITGECSELLMQHSSPASQNFTPDYSVSTRNLYQSFSFVKSIIDSDGFRDAMNRIISIPVTGYKDAFENKDIRRLGRVNSRQVIQIALERDRISLPKNHPLSSSLNSIPSYLSISSNVKTVNTIENRFIKHVLIEFERFCDFICSHIEEKGNVDYYIYKEAKELKYKFLEYLDHNMFREVENLNSLPLNNPVLQRKEGYREILKIWLLYGLASKLLWDSIDDDSYRMGKRDVATLYEYWIFFKLLRLVEDIFQLEKNELGKLVSITKDGLGFKLKEGSHFSVKGEFLHRGKNLKIRYSYNRTFSKNDYPFSGSWSQPMRPDYSLSIWPSELKENDAEELDLISHIHFDSKYRVDDLDYLTNKKIQDSITNDKEFEKKGKYKRSDLLKMHAYKDSIRRTLGAYVLYPGVNKYIANEFFGTFPSIGAFPITPSDKGKGIESIRSFLVEFINHSYDFINDKKINNKPKSGKVY
jgi:predicted component of viral defense system (DUF524 family)